MTQHSEFDDITSRARTMVKQAKTHLYTLLLMITLHDEAALDHLHCKSRKHFVIVVAQSSIYAN